MNFCPGKTMIFCLCLPVVIISYGRSNRVKQNQLKSLHGNIDLKVCSYSGTDIIKERNGRNENIRQDNRAWQLQLQTKNLNSEATDVLASFSLREGNAASTAVAVSFNFSRWSRKNYVMVPAAVYNGNRYRTIGNAYNPPYTKEMYFNPSLPLTISNNPRLSFEKGIASAIELQTGNCATPAMCFYSAADHKGFILLSEQKSRWGNYGYSIKENASGDSCSFTIFAPSMRKYAAGFGDFHLSGDKAPDWKTGDELSIHLKYYVFEASSIDDVLLKFIQVRKALTGVNEPRNLLPMSTVLSTGTKICSNNFVTTKAGSYYMPENSRDFQLGWVSGMMNTYSMLALNDETERKRVIAELDFITNKLQGTSGYFYGGISADGKLLAEKMHPDFTAPQAMVRKNGDVLFWLIKHFLLLKAQGYGELIKPSWEDAAKKLAMAFVNTWRKHEQFGQYIVPSTGEIAVFNSTAGAIVPAGLVLASEYFSCKEWLHVAEESTNYYYNRDVHQQGLTGGDCGDISQDANSESAFAFLQSLMVLYEATANKEWLKKAEVQAALCSSWVLSYDAFFPANSDIGKLDGKMAGAVWASIQNKHAAPGICTSSGDYLFWLYRATGKKLYADLIRDIQHAHAEAVNMPGHITTNNLIGSSMERIQPGDAEGRGSIGNFINTRNSWTETNGMLMALELPGIYVNKKNRQVICFDHVTASIIKYDGDTIVLKVRNDTRYDANVSVFAESVNAPRPIAITTFLQWPKFAVAAGEEKCISVKCLK